MHYAKRVFKIGGSLAIGIPRMFIEDQKFKEGDLVIIRENGRKIEIENMQDIIDNYNESDKGGHNVTDGSNIDS